MNDLFAFEILQFNSLTRGFQLIYALNIMAGLVMPLSYVQQAKKYRSGTAGVGDTCVKAMVWAAFCRMAPMVYCFTVIWSVPLFFAVALDFMGRVWVIIEALRAEARRRGDTGSDETSNPGFPETRFYLARAKPQTVTRFWRGQ